MTTSPLACRARHGFSLIELLVVCAIIVVVVGFTVPAATTLIRGSQLTQAAQMVSDQLVLARQQALSKNRPVEVRFYRFGDKESPGENSDDPESGKYRALQVFEIIESGAAIPLNKIQRLPATVVFNRGGMSTIISDAVRGAAKRAEDDPSAPELARDVRRKYQYQAFRFLPDGSTDLPVAQTSETAGDGNWYVTLHSLELSDENNEPKNPKGETINFFTLQVDPVSGATKSYRPTAG